MLIPAGDIVISDDFSTGSPNYKDFLYTAASQTGVGGNFDGNGQMLRVQGGGGPTLAQSPLPGADPTNTPLWGYTIQNPTGTQPVRPARPAADQDGRQVREPGSARRERAGSRGWSARSGGGDAVRQAIGRYSKDFVAVVILALIGLATLFVILSQQASALPSWFPILGEDRFELKAQVQTAQAVTPGQGQTVNMAGVKIGDITEVELSDGVAVITMQVDNEYSDLIHADASILMRPRTGLQDMTVELDAGTGTESVRRGHDDPAGIDEAQRQRRSDPRLARRRHPGLPAAAARRRRRGPRRRSRRELSAVLRQDRADRPRHREDQRCDGQAARATCAA